MRAHFVAHSVISITNCIFFGIEIGVGQCNTNTSIWIWSLVNTSNVDLYTYNTHDVLRDNDCFFGWPFLNRETSFWIWFLEEKVKEVVNERSTLKILIVRYCLHEYADAFECALNLIPLRFQWHWIVWMIHAYIV